MTSPAPSNQLEPRTELRDDPNIDYRAFRAYANDKQTGKMVRACTHYHRSNKAAFACAVRLIGSVNRERGIRRKRGPIPESMATPGQMRTRLAFAAGHRAAAVVRMRVNLLISTHEGHDGAYVMESDELGPGVVFGTHCGGCDLDVRIVIENRKYDYDK